MMMEKKREKYEERLGRDDCLRAQLIGQQLGDLFQERCELRVQRLLVAQKALRGGVDVLHAGHALGESHDAGQQGQHLAHQAVILLQHALCLFDRLERVLLEFPSLVREHARGSQISERTDEVKVATMRAVPSVRVRVAGRPELLRGWPDRHSTCA
jgi:hypothetical protein